jgi:hypothetical protein
MAAPLPVACSLDSHALSCRQSELRVSILAEAQQVDRLPDGIRWTFHQAPDLFARLGPIIDGERHCYPFLRIAIVADQDVGAVTATITGPPGTVDLLEGWIASAA